MNILGRNKKLSYEGEGMRIGLKTLLFFYPGEKKIKLKGDVLGIYVTTNQFDSTLFQYLSFYAKQDKLITIETEMASKIPVKFRKLKNIIFFRSTTIYNGKEKIYSNEFIKIRILEECNLNKLIVIANNYCIKNKKLNNRVLLMPEFVKDPSKILKEKFNRINQGVRFMPPIQNVLNID